MNGQLRNSIDGSQTVGASDGSVGAVRVFAPGIEAEESRWVSLSDGLELALLEAAADQTNTVADLVDMFLDEAPEDPSAAVTAGDVIARLRHLWELTLIAL